ncbi:centrosomal protein of 19 kDa-like [Lepeophtheirus salmonis]|uniref:centrosomal protein of 19 kDa-like n=1 Tax=Lepeophtheirus salmonis TaxID=72036 RepID=UPI003AF37CA9
MTQSGVPRKLGLTFSPPSLILIYEDGSGKQRRRSMPVRNLNKHSQDLYPSAIRFRKRHEPFMDSVQAIQIEKYLRVLQEMMKGCKSIESALKIIESEFTINISENMNALSDLQLQRRKEIMDKTFNKNRVKEGDKDYIFDKQVDFSGESKIESGWDYDEEDNFWG